MLPRDLRRKLGKIASGETVAPVKHIETASPDPTPITKNTLEYIVMPSSYDPASLGIPAPQGQGTFHLMEYPVSLLAPGVDLIYETLLKTLPPVIQPEQILFLDIETTSLTSAQPLFLIGLVLIRDNQLTVVQLFARDYTEEPLLISYLNQLIQSCKLIVTYNGKTFDIPYLRDRALYHRQPLVFNPDHLDLLPAARIAFKGVYRNCKLQTLEENLCGRRRLDDTPGSLIPELYHQFVKTGDWNPLKGIFFHNALDLLTTAELLGHSFAWK